MCYLKNPFRKYFLNSSAFHNQKKAKGLFTQQHAIPKNCNNKRMHQTFSDTNYISNANHRSTAVSFKKCSLSYNSKICFFPYRYNKGKKNWKSQETFLVKYKK